MPVLYVAGKARTETLRVRLTVAEKSAVEEAAAQSGNASEWARERLLAGLPVERKGGQLEKRHVTWRW